ncbi:MAG: hypothetical protein Q8M01_19605 [Rubrivivax sp.]|nr:hypothetical protein [Rubrivivax sp.]
MEEIDLSDLAFDFEDYFERHRRGEMSDEEREEFDARVIGIFCRRMLMTANADGHWNEWENFAAYHLAKKLRMVIGGVPWRKSIRLPFEWGTYESDYSRTDQRAIEIFCAIRNSLQDNPDGAVTDLISTQAAEHCVSFETARADYYRVKLAFDNGVGFKPFLKFD